jgi:hypothetical protein
MAFGKAIGEVIDAYSAFDGQTGLFEKVDDDPEKLAWLLIHRSLLSAAKDFISDHGPRLRATYQSIDEPLEEEDVADHFDDSLDVTLDDAHIQISASFFDRPTDLGLSPYFCVKVLAR